eukprot:214375-Pyramimonas_sp.AAC.1
MEQRSSNENMVRTVIKEVHDALSKIAEHPAFKDIVEQEPKTMSDGGAQASFKQADMNAALNRDGPGLFLQTRPQFYVAELRVVVQTPRAHQQKPDQGIPQVRLGATAAAQAHSLRDGDCVGLSHAMRDGCERCLATLVAPGVRLRGDLQHQGCNHSRSWR